MGKPGWYGSKKKKKGKGKGTELNGLFFPSSNPNSRNNTIRFIKKPLSNIDLLQWVTQLGIKYFRGIYSRDNLPQKIHKLETGIINLDDSMGGGSHWVCYRNVDKQFCEYFVCSKHRETDESTRPWCLLKWNNKKLCSEMFSLAGISLFPWVVLINKTPLKCKCLISDEKHVSPQMKTWWCFTWCFIRYQDSSTWPK